MTNQIGMSGYLRKEDMLVARVKDLTRQRDEALAEGFRAGFNSGLEEARKRITARWSVKGYKEAFCGWRVSEGDDAIRALNKVGTEHKENEK